MPFALSTQNRHVATSPLHFLVVVRVRYSSYLHTKQRQLWLHVSFFTYFNQPLNIPDTKNPHKRVILRRPCVRSDSILFQKEIP